MSMVLSVSAQDIKTTLLNNAQKADAKGDIVSAQQAYCGLAQMDASAQTPAGSAKEACATYTAEANKAQKRWAQNYDDGMAALQKQDFDTAELKFKNVKGGDKANEAKKQLANIADLRKQGEQQKQNAAADDVSNRAFQLALNAYAANNFTSALAGFEQVSGSRKPEAQDYINKIQQYQAKITEAQGYESSRNYAAAAAAYQSAANIKPDGPGSPGAAVTRVQSLNASSQPTQAASATPARSSGAIKDEGAKLDEGRLLAEARALLAKKQYAKANSLVNRVLGQNFKNAEAAQLQKEISDAGGKAATSNTNEDPYLAGLLKAFYQGNYDDAEAGLRTYIVQPQVQKPGLANFYLGATVLTRYYLSGGADQKLYQEAIRRFKDATDKAGFVVPEKFVSPKILKVFAESTKAKTPPS